MQDRAKATRDAILSGAAAVFEEMGYGRASLSQVAERAGVTKGALYFHFQSKDELARAVIAEQHRFVTADNASVLSQGLPPLESMIVLCRRFALNLLQHSIVRAGTRLTLEASIFHEDIRQPYEDWVEVMGQLAVRAQEQGQLRSDVDAAAFARLVVSALTGVQITSAVLAGRDDLLERVEQMWELMLPGVVAPSLAGRADELARFSLA
ncbi:ScbR family autoregulator-binding transcription factor [Arthrobacter sp. 3Tela_A]|uniref:ScbR family autoregulator-binding transcription factor n=1 Tax=Arthrobacter sp. 3Tela_A TaxID=3093743 RepID=UPI003BB687A3